MTNPSRVIQKQTDCFGSLFPAQAHHWHWTVGLLRQLLLFSVQSNILFAEWRHILQKNQFATTRTFYFYCVCSQILFLLCLLGFYCSCTRYKALAMPTFKSCLKTMGWCFSGFDGRDCPDRFVTYQPDEVLRVGHSG